MQFDRKGRSAQGSNGIHNNVTKAKVNERRRYFEIFLDSREADLGTTQEVQARKNTLQRFSCVQSPERFRNFGEGNSRLAKQRLGQTNGQIVVGITNLQQDFSPMFIVARLSTNGSLDTTFGNGCIVETQVGTWRRGQRPRIRVGRPCWQPADRCWVLWRCPPAWRMR
jgi:hypothetical protein